MKKNFLLTLSLVSSLSFAADSLETIEVSENSSTAPASAERTEKLSAIPGGVSGVVKESYEGTRAVSVKDMLEYSPGIFAQTRYGEESRLSIRGSGLSRTVHLRGIRLLQDGIQVNSADGGGDFQEIDPMSYEYVEVYRGANAFSFGVPNLGGAINFITKTGKNSPGMKTRVEGGSFGTHREVISYGADTGKFDHFVNLTNLYTEGYRNHSEQSSRRFNSNIGIKNSPNFEQRFYLMWQNLDQEIPGSLTKKDAMENPTTTNPTAWPLNQKRDLDVKRIAHKISWTPTGHEVNGNWFITRKRLYHPIFQILDNRSTNYGVSGDVTGFTSIADMPHAIKVGAQFTYGETDALRFTNLRGDRGAQTAKAVERAKNLDLLLEDKIFLSEKVELSIGSLFIISERDYHDEFRSDGDRSDKKLYRGAAPRVGLMYEEQSKRKYFANVSQSIEPPTFSELTQSLPGVSGLANLAAQKATTIEIGTRQEFESTALDLTIYRSWIKDELMSFQVNASGASGVLNADETIHQGIELGGSQKLFKNTTAKVNYTLGDYFFKNDSQWNDNQLPGIPRHFFRGEIEYKKKKITISPNVEWVPESYPVDMANTMWANPYVVYGLRSKFSYKEKSFVFMDIRNLTDKRYIATTGVITRPNNTNRLQFTPADGFGIFFGAEHAW